MSQVSEGRTKGLPETTGATLAEYRAVKLVTDGITLASVGGGADVIGFTGIDQSALGDEVWPVILRNAGGTVKLFMATAVSKYGKVYAAADGKGSNVALGQPIAIALEAATAAGDIIEVLPIENAASDDLFEIHALGATALTAAQFAASGLTLGQVAYDSYGNKYKLVKVTNVNDGNIVGYPLGVRAAGASELDLSDDLAASAEYLVRGLSASKFATTAIYGWMLIEGSLETALDGAGMSVVTDGNVAQGDSLYWGADGKLYGIVPTATMTDHTFCGSSTVADTGTALGAAQVNFTALNSHGVA